MKVIQIFKNYQLLYKKTSVVPTYHQNLRNNSAMIHDTDPLYFHKLQGEIIIFLTSP